MRWRWVAIACGATTAHAEGRAWLGASLVDGAGGPVVAAVPVCSPAAKAGIAPGDVVVALDGSVTRSWTAARALAYVGTRAPGESLGVEVVRGGRSVAVTAWLWAGPEPADARLGTPAPEPRGLVTAWGAPLGPLAGLRDRAVVLVFAPVACGEPCDAIAAVAAGLAARSDARVFGITREDLRVVKARASDAARSYTVMGDVEGSTAKDYKVGLATLFVIDRRGLFVDATTDPVLERPRVECAVERAR